MMLMRRVLPGFLACLLIAAASAQLDALIQQNVRSATTSYGNLTSQKKSGGSQLWIHVRSDAQRRLADDKMSWLKSLQIDGTPVVVKPIQLVSNGPGESQLRYFKREDRDTAEQLRKQLVASIDGLRLADFSGQYQNSRWLKPGHFELWLAPTVARFTAP